jgi:hypothetical protein
MEIDHEISGFSVKNRKIRRFLKNQESSLTARPGLFYETRWRQREKA